MLQFLYFVINCSYYKISLIMLSYVWISAYCFNYIKYTVLTYPLGLLSSDTYTLHIRPCTFFRYPPFQRSICLSSFDKYGKSSNSFIRYIFSANLLLTIWHDMKRAQVQENAILEPLEKTQDNTKSLRQFYDWYIFYALVKATTRQERGADAERCYNLQRLMGT